MTHNDEQEGTTSAEDAELVRVCRGWLSPHWDGALPPEAQQDFRRAAARIEALSRQPKPAEGATPNELSQRLRDEENWPFTNDRTKALLNQAADRIERLERELAAMTENAILKDQAIDRHLAALSATREPTVPGGVMCRWCGADIPPEGRQSATARLPAEPTAEALWAAFQSAPKQRRISNPWEAGPAQMTEGLLAVWNAALAAAAPSQAEQPAAREDGWVVWRGGKECPVDVLTLDLVRFRDGSEHPGHAVGPWIWKHSGEDDDIVAYRVADSEKAG